MAGKRKGTDDERYLWGEMLRAIQEIKPKFVIAENVFGITNIDGGLVFEQVCLDLETEGYEVQPFIIPAASKNAPHRRDRVWFVGIKNVPNTECKRLQSGSEPGKIRTKKRIVETERNQLANEFASSISKWNAPYTLSKRPFWGDKSRETNFSIRKDSKLWRNITRYNKKINESDAPDTNSNGFNQCNGHDEINPSQGGVDAFGNIVESHVNGDVTNTPSSRGRQNYRKGKSGFHDQKGQTDNWGDFPTQSPICSGDDGLPTELDGITFSKWRKESIKGYGNAIVPQVAYELFKIIEKL